MFSSIASYFFGSNTPAITTNSETNQNPTDQNQQQQVDDNILRIDAENTILVSSLTPSVTGNNRNHNIVQQQQQQPQGKRGKNKRKWNNKKQAQPSASKQQESLKFLPPPTLTKLLTPTESFDGFFDESEWCIVEKEDEEVSLPQTDSEEELSIVEAKPKSASAASTPVHGIAAAAAAAERRQLHRLHQQQQHISSHSLYSGPRPQQQRNLRSRNSGTRHNNNNNGSATNNQRSTFNSSSLSPPRSISIGVGSVDAVGLADGDMTRSLYVVASNDHEGSGGYSGSEYGYGANISMEESWFVTPPPCFTSIGPINMETSPFENLLIEHPSMSVYRSIRSAQEATESFVNLDLGVEESQERRQEVISPAPAAAAENRRNNARTPRAHIEGLTAAQLKQELLARSNQKVHDKKQRETWCRGAMKRANMARDYQSKGGCQRRADRQHCKVVSGANNNRKSYF